MSDSIRIRIATMNSSHAEFMDALDRYWASVRSRVESAAGDSFSRTVEQIIRATRELLGRLSTNPNAHDRLWSWASTMFTSAQILGAPEISKDEAAQIVNRIGRALLEIRLSIIERTI